MLKTAFGKQKLIPVPADPPDQGPGEPGKKTESNKCPSCFRPLAELELQENLSMCPKCGYYFTMTAWERINLLADEGSFKERDADLNSVNFLGFPGYDDKLAEAKNRTGLNEAVITGECSLGGFTVVIAAMDSRFMMSSMGSVVGEKICRAAERAMELKCPLITIAASGGARMQEGMLALMQMAKTGAVIKKLHEQGLLYISIMTNPTTGGVTASFASLADIIIAEPGALIGFAGPRVIKQTIGEVLPANFQRSEFLMEHGMVDLIIERSKLKDTLQLLLKLHSGGKKHG